MWVRKIYQDVSLQLLHIKVFHVCVCLCACSDAAQTVIHSADAFAPVGYLHFTEMHTESKDSVSQTSEGIQECNLFSPNKISAFRCWINHLTAKVWVATGSIKSPWRAKQIEEQTFWCLITLSSRRDTRHHGAGFRSTSRGPPSFSLSFSLPPSVSLLVYSCSQCISSSLSSSPTWPTLTSAIFTAAWN